MKCLTRGLASMVVVLTANLAQAQEIAPAAAGSAPRREIAGQLGASVNNAGLQNTVEVAWTWPLSRSTHPLLSGAHMATGMTHAITPAQTRIGGWIEYAPLSIASVRVGVNPAAYFGTFNSLMSFDHYTDPFSKDERDRRGGAKAGTALQAHVSPTVKLKAGPIVAMATGDFEWWRSSAPGAFFYEPTRDTLLKSGGDRLVSTTAVAMAQRATGSGGTLSAGVIHTVTRVFDAPANQIQKVGFIAIKEFASAHLHIARPRLTLVVARYLDDPSKANQWTAAMAVGFRR